MPLSSVRTVGGLVCQHEPSIKLLECDFYLDLTIPLESLKCIRMVDFAKRKKRILREYIRRKAKLTIAGA